MVKEYACRRCKSLSHGKICPLCSSTDLSAQWTGLVIINNPEKSEVAKTLGISKPGRYALKIG